jgi:DNA-binding IclR family transcriptional regulator
MNSAFIGGGPLNQLHRQTFQRIGTALSTAGTGIATLHGDNVSPMRRTEDAPAVRRALDVLQRLRRSGVNGLSPAELLEALNLPRASMYRILRTLQGDGLVMQDARSGRYRLGFESVALGYVARENHPLVQAALPMLRSISQQTHEMSELIVAVSGWELITLEVWQAESTPLRFRARSGMMFGLTHTTAHGLVYLSYCGERRLAEYLKTPPGKDAPAALRDQCARWRKLGYAWLRQSHPSGNARLAVPVFDPRARSLSVAAVLGVACDSDHIDGLRAAQWAPILQAQARELEKKI